MNRDDLAWVEVFATVIFSPLRFDRHGEAYLRFRPFLVVGYSPTGVRYLMGTEIDGLMDSWLV